MLAAGVLLALSAQQQGTVEYMKHMLGKHAYAMLHNAQLPHGLQMDRTTTPEWFHNLAPPGDMPHKI
eukprot:1155830-Pelagomonas_calceolata.AAC.8